MKSLTWYLAALAPFALFADSATHAGYAVVVLLAVGIFHGTLAMDRATRAA